jgi:hypothetical protein
MLLKVVFGALQVLLEWHPGFPQVAPDKQFAKILQFLIGEPG